MAVDQSSLDSESALEKERRDQLDLALRSASMGVWHWDIVENRRYFDAQACHLLGIDPAAFTGTAEEFFSAVHPDDRDVLVTALAKTVAFDVPYEPEYRAVWPDGSIHYVAARGKLVRDANHQPSRINGIIWDVTERRITEQALRESEEMFRTVASSAHDAIVMADDEGKVILWNDSAEKMFGYSAAEALGKSLLELIVPQRYREEHTREFARFSKTSEGQRIGQTIELLAVRKGGAEFSIELSLSAVRYKGKWSSVGIIRDIDERKENEARLKLFRALLDNSIDDIEVVDPLTLKILDVNEAACRNLGYSREEMLGMRIFDIDSMLNEKDVENINEEIRRSGRARFESLHRRKDGTEFPVEINASTIMLDRPYGLSIARDITDRKQSQKELEYKTSLLSTQLETSPDGILLVDETGKILSYNQRFLVLWNIDEALLQSGQDEPVLQKAIALAADPESFAARVRYLYEHKGEKSYEEIPLKDGRIFERHSAPVIGAGGRYYGRVWYFRDITDRKRAEHLLKESLTEKEELVEQLNELAIRDGLTGLYNHRSFHALLREEIERSQRSKTSVSLLMIDIDHFKKVNDTYGHQAGDAILRALAGLLLRCARTIDRVCRYGGEEITIIVPGSSLEPAALMAERLRSAVEAYEYPVSAGVTVRITVSIGVASWPEQSRDAMSLIASADAAMYLAKKNGRNRVCQSPATVTPAPGT